MLSVSKGSRFSAKSQVIIDAQDKEIARLKKLLAQAGIDFDQVYVSASRAASRAVRVQVVVAQVHVHVQYARHARYNLYVRAARAARAASAAKAARVVEVVEAVKDANVVKVVKKSQKLWRSPYRIKLYLELVMKMPKMPKSLKSLLGSLVFRVPGLKMPKSLPVSFLFSSTMPLLFPLLPLFPSGLKPSLSTSSNIRLSLSLSEET